MSKTAPRQSRAFKRVVQHDPVYLGDQERPANPPGFQQEFSDRVRGKILRGGLHHNERPVTPKGLAFRGAVVVVIDHRQQTRLYARKVRTLRGGSREFEPGRRDTRQGTEHLLPDMREVFKGRVKFDLFDLGPAFGERLRHPLQALPGVGGTRCLAIASTAAMSASRAGASSGNVPSQPASCHLCPPIQECACDIDRVDFQRPVEEAVRR